MRANERFEQSIACRLESSNCKAREEEKSRRDRCYLPNQKNYRIIERRGATRGDAGRRNQALAGGYRSHRIVGTVGSQDRLPCQSHLSFYSKEHTVHRDLHAEARLRNRTVCGSGFARSLTATHHNTAGGEWQREGPRDGVPLMHRSTAPLEKSHAWLTDATFYLESKTKKKK